MKTDMTILTAATTLVIGGGLAYLGMTGRLDPVQDAARKGITELIETVRPTTPPAPPGYRYVGLRVNLPASRASWWKLEGMRVDVINTIRRTGDKSSYSHFLLEDVRILSIDGSPQHDESGHALPGNIVMFVLSPEDCLRLNLAADMGILTVVERKTSETGTEAPDVNGFAPTPGSMSQALDSLPELQPSDIVAKLYRETGNIPTSPNPRYWGSSRLARCRTDKEP